MCFWILGNVFRFWDVFWILESVFGFWDVFFILWEVFCPYEPPYINTDIGAKPAVTGLYLYYTTIKTTTPACGCMWVRPQQTDFSHWLRSTDREQAANEGSTKIHWIAIEYIRITLSTGVFPPKFRTLRDGYVMLRIQQGALTLFLASRVFPGFEVILQLSFPGDVIASYSIFLEL